MGWGGYKPRKKTKEMLAIERRRELAKQFPGGIDELIALAAACRKKANKLPPAPHPDHEVIIDPAPSVIGPCQRHVASMKAWRAGAVVPPSKTSPGRSA